MNRRIIALGVIFICSCIAWSILAVVVDQRTEDKRDSGSSAVGQLWGVAQTQTAPIVQVEWRTTTRKEVRETTTGWEYVGEQDQDNEAAESESTQVLKEGTKDTNSSARPQNVLSGIISTKHVSEKVREKNSNKKRKGEPLIKKTFEVREWKHTVLLPLAATDAKVDLDVAYRKRGLLWFSTYGVAFESKYTVANPFDHPVNVTMTFAFPSSSAIYDNMAVTTPGIDDLHVTAENGQMVSCFPLAAGQVQQVNFGYKSRGMDRWNYRFGENVEMVENFNLVMLTNFDSIDFPMGSISPDLKKPRSDKPGFRLTWRKKSLVSGLEVGMLMPHRINPGPLASAMSAHAPVSLFFFFFVIFIMQVLKGLKIHPMNYFFIAASFFSFNLLFSYLVSHLDIFVSFGLSSAVSIFLVVSYLKLVVHTRFAIVEAGISQFIYQILFSVAHFLEGYTGLTVTIGAIVTLAVVMRLTARVDWEMVFKTKPGLLSQPAIVAKK